jgi:hypothetical protein
MKTAPGFGRASKNAGLPECCEFLHFRTSGSAMGGFPTFAHTRANGEVAQIPYLPALIPERGGSVRG